MEEDEKPVLTFSDTYEESLWLDTYQIVMAAVLIGETISRPGNHETVHEKNERHVRYANYVADTALIEARKRRPVRMMSMHRIKGILGDWRLLAKLILAKRERNRTNDFTSYFSVKNLLKRRKMERFPVWPTDAVVKCAYIASIAAALTTVVGILTIFDTGEKSATEPLDLVQSSCVEPSSVP